MEIADVRKRVLQTIDRARRTAAARRVRVDEAAREYGTFLQQTAVPLFRQVGNALRAEGYPFSVSTPAGSVRLASDRSADDYIEVLLDASGHEPVVTGTSRRTRGHQVIESQRRIGSGAPEALTEEDVLGFLLKELESFVDR
jgi:hypothetical protein